MQEYRFNTKWCALRAALSARWNQRNTAKSAIRDSLLTQTFKDWNQRANGRPFLRLESLSHKQIQFELRSCVIRADYNHLRWTKTWRAWLSVRPEGPFRHRLDGTLFVPKSSTSFGGGSELVETRKFEFPENAILEQNWIKFTSEIITAEFGFDLNLLL